jgi:hypothetical protein
VLPYGHGRQEDRHDSILAERKTVFRLSGDLKNELPVSALVEKLIGRRPADGQSTETNGRDVKQRFWSRSSRFSRTSSMP